MGHAFNLLTILAYVALFGVGVGFYVAGAETSALIGVGAVLAAYLGLAQLLERLDVSR